MNHPSHMQDDEDLAIASYQAVERNSDRYCLLRSLLIANGNGEHDQGEKLQAILHEVDAQITPSSFDACIDKALALHDRSRGAVLHVVGSGASPVEEAAQSIATIYAERARLSKLMRLVSIHTPEFAQGMEILSQAGEA